MTGACVPPDSGRTLICSVRKQLLKGTRIMITPHNLYDKNGIFGLVYKGTSTTMAALPQTIRDTWTEGDLWYDTTADDYKTYNGTSWIASGALQGGSVTAVTGTTDTISAANDSGKINSYTNAAITVTLAADMTGIITTLVYGGTGTMHVDPDSTDTLSGGYLGNGGAGKKITTSETGAWVRILGISATASVIVDMGGTWTREA